MQRSPSPRRAGAAGRASPAGPDSRAALPSLGRGALTATLALLLALLAAAFPPPARAEVTLEVLQVGWDDTVVPGTWTPVRVRATGDETTATALVEVVLKYRHDVGPSGPSVEQAVAAYGQEVSLPAGVTKDVTIWVPVDGNMVGVVRLLSDGQALAEQEIQFRSARTPFWPLVGVLADSPTIARAITRVELPFQGLPIPLSVAQLAPDDLPSEAGRLSALSAVVVQGNAAASLTREQREAVVDWIVEGGHLLVAGGPDAPRALALLPEGTLPVTFVGSERDADLDPLALWAGVPGSDLAPGPAVRFTAAAGAPLVGPADHPLAWRTTLGRGSVTLLAVDPSLDPLASWDGLPALLKKALEPALPSGAEDEKLRAIAMDARDVALRLQSAAEALPPEAYPDWRAVAALLGGFALVVGPLLHLALARADRRGLVWLAVPGAAVLVSAALYVVGIGYGGRDVIANVVSYVRLDPASGRAQQALAAGFFAPTHERLPIVVAGDVPARAATQSTIPALYGGVPRSPGSSSEPPFRVIGGRDTRVEFASGEWAMRHVMLERPLEQTLGSITADLRLEDGIIKGTARNDTPYTFEDAAIVVGQSLVKLGTLAPGQTVPVALDPVQDLNPFQGSPPLSYRLFGRTPEELATERQGGAATGPVSQVSVARAVVSQGAPMPVPPVPMPKPYPMEYLELPRDPEVQRRVRLLDAVVNVPRPGPGPLSLPLTFFGFTRAPMGPDVSAAGSHPTYHLTLVEQPLALSLPSGSFTIPPALIPGEIVEQTFRGYGGGSNGTLYWIELQGGTMVYSFRPPLPPEAEVEALRIATQQVGSTFAAGSGRGYSPPSPNAAADPAEPGVFAVYNWETASWDPLPGGSPEARLTLAGPYLGPDGEVRVRVGKDDETGVRFVPPTLTVEGRMP